MKIRIFFLFGLLWPFCSHSQTITVSGSPFSFRSNADSDRINIPVKLDNGSLADLKIADHPWSVRNGSSSDDDYVNAIKITASDVNGPHLTVVVKPALLMAQGNYDVYVAYTAKNKPTAWLNFVLARPAATLVADKLTITQTGSCVVKNQLNLTESSGNGGVRQLALMDPIVPATRHGALIKLRAHQLSIVPGGNASVDFDVIDTVLAHMPLGETTGEYQISSTQLSAPVKIQLDIWRKRSETWLIGAIFIGMVVGMLVRHVLKDSRATEQSRSIALQLIHDIKTASGKIPDTVFQAKIDQLTGALLSAINLTSIVGQQDIAAAITTAIADAKTAYDKAKDDLQDRHDKAKSLYEDLRQAFVIDQFETGLSGWFNPTIVYLNEIKAKLDLYDIVPVSDLLTQASDSFDKGKTRYMAYLTSVLDFLGNKDFYMPETFKATVDFQPGITALANKLTTFTADTAGNTRLQILQLLNNDQTELRKIVGSTVSAVGKQYEQSNPQFFAKDEFQQVYLKWSAGLKNLVLNPSDADQAGEIWDEKLLTVMNTVWTQISTGILGDSVTASTPSVSHVVITPVILSREQLKQLKLSNIEKTYQTSSWRYWVFTLLQTFLLSIVIGLAACLTYGPKFVGTWNDLVMLFLAGFSLDITVDSVTQLKAKASS